VEIFDPLSPAMLADPYPVYATLRREDPVHWHEGLRAWVLTRYADCVRVLKDPQTFGSDFRTIGEQAPEETLSLQTLDGPAHAALRRVIGTAMRAVDPADLAVAVTDAVDKQLRRIDLDRFDFITEFAEPVGIATMCSYLGIPGVDDLAEFAAAHRDLIVSFDSGLQPEARQPGLRARNQLNKVIATVVDRRPPTGMLSGLFLGADGPPRIQVINAVRGIFGAGYGSSSSMWGNALRALLEHALLDRPLPPDVTPVTVNELIRYDGAVQAESRAVNADVEIGGRRVRRGQTVVTVLGAANRDPARFDQPDDLVLGRRPNPHIGFGMGVHACVGGQVGLIVGTRLIGLLARRCRMRLLESPAQRPTATLRGLDHLIVSATYRDASGAPATNCRLPAGETPATCQEGR
jgi:cytochrome P450